MVKVKIHRPQEVTLIEFLTMYANQAEKDIEELTARLALSYIREQKLKEQLENGGIENE